MTDDDIYVVANLCEMLTSDHYERWATGYALICSSVCILKVGVDFHCFVCLHDKATSIFVRKLVVRFLFTDEIPLTLGIIMLSRILHRTIEQALNAETVPF